MRTFIFSSLILSVFSLPVFAQEKTVDLVTLGKEIFHSVGCAECHSEIKNDTAVKTGPGLYGLFQKIARTRDVIESGEQHKHTVKADLSYLKSSLRTPNTDLAIAENGATKGQTYLPVMPPYATELVSDFKLKAIHSYLLTLNDANHRGPTKVIVKDPGEDQVSRTIDDRGEILVTDRTRIYRARLKNASARAIYVGTPSGLNYSFDPRTLSIERLWWGGFINITEELNGRAKKMSRLGEQAQEVRLENSLLRPHHPSTGKIVDFSFKSPKAHDYKTIGKNLNSPTDFLEQIAQVDASFLGYSRPQSLDGQPSFHYRVGKNRLSMIFSTQPDGQASIALSGALSSDQTFSLPPEIVSHAKVSVGQLKGTTWTIPATREKLSATIHFSLSVPQNIWRPVGAKSSPVSQQATVSPISAIRLPRGYMAESISPPLDAHERPQLFEPLGIDFTKSGALIVSTRTAGIWRYEAGKWTQIAEGLLDALGLIVEDDKGHRLIVGQKAELTRLIDRDGDGVIDLYQTLCDDFLYTSNYHEYLHGPAKGTDGNYYIALNLSERHGEEIYKAGGRWMGTQGGLRGWGLQVTPKGKMSLFANGLRSPAGLATSPDGHLYYTENQGEYVGTSKLFRLEEGKFYGHPSSLVDLPRMTPKSAAIGWNKVKGKKETPLALLAHSRLANSPGSPAWDTTKGKFGPFSQQMFIGDQTLSNLFRVLPISTHRGHESAIIPFAQSFPSGVMRLAFSPEGSLYVGQTGRGWRSRGGKEAALIRLHRTTTPSNQLHHISRQKNVFTLTFTQPLKTLPQLGIRSWTYIDSPEYGSKETNVRNEDIKTIKLSSDKKSLIVTLKNLPSSKKGSTRLYQLTSKQLPHNNGSIMEAFYSICLN